MATALPDEHSVFFNITFFGSELNQTSTSTLESTGVEEESVGGTEGSFSSKCWRDFLLAREKRKEEGKKKHRAAIRDPLGTLFYGEVSFQEDRNR